MKRSRRRAYQVMPNVHHVASRLQRWLLGIHHGGVQERHLDDYLDEFTCRFNRRTSRSRGLLLSRLLQQAVARTLRRTERWWLLVTWPTTRCRGYWSEVDRHLVCFVYFAYLVVWPRPKGSSPR